MSSSNAAARFKCESCDKTYGTALRRDSHHAAVHLQLRAFRCPKCDKAFVRKDVLQVHITAVHDRERYS